MWKHCSPLLNEILWLLKRATKPISILKKKTDYWFLWQIFLDVGVGWQLPLQVSVPVEGNSSSEPTGKAFTVSSVFSRWHICPPSPGLPEVNCPCSYVGISYLQISAESYIYFQTQTLSLSHVFPVYLPEVSRTFLWQLKHSRSELSRSNYLSSFKNKQLSISFLQSLLEGCCSIFFLPTLPFPDGTK